MAASSVQDVFGAGVISIQDVLGFTETSDQDVFGAGVVPDQEEDGVGTILDQDVPGTSVMLSQINTLFTKVLAETPVKIICSLITTIGFYRTCSRNTILGFKCITNLSCCRNTS